MSCQNINELIKTYAEDAITEQNLNYFSGKIVAIDVIPVILEFKRTLNLQHNGNVTSHLKGLFNRTIGLLEEGIKPVYVFDGKLSNFTEGSRRGYQLSDSYENECQDAKKMLKLMDVPIIEAESIAGIKCSEMVRSKEAYCAATNIDGLAFGTKIVLRDLKLGKNRKEHKVEEIKLEDVINRLGLNEDSFIDLCVLLGLNCEKVSGMGPKTAYKKIKEHGSGENIFLNDTKYKNKKPNGFDEACRTLKELRIKNENSQTTNFYPERMDPKEKQLIEFLCNDRGSDEILVRNGIKKLKKLDVNANAQ